MHIRSVPAATIGALFALAGAISGQTPDIYIDRPNPMPIAFFQERYSVQLRLAGGPGQPASNPAPSFDSEQVTWSANGLPGRLEIDARTGLISGSATQPGYFTVTIEASVPGGRSTRTSFHLAVVRRPCRYSEYEISYEDVNICSNCCRIAAGPASTMSVGQKVSESLAATGVPSVTHQWGTQSGQLPPGLSLSDRGVLSGTPTTAGTFHYTISAIQRVGKDTNSGSLRCITTVAGPPAGNPAGLAISTDIALPPGDTGAPYSVALKAVGGAEPYVWSAAGALPPGLTLSTAGVLAGTPLSNSLYQLSVKVTDAKNVTASGILLLRIGPVPAKITLTAVTPDAVLVSNRTAALRITGSGFVAGVKLAWNMKADEPVILDAILLNSSELVANVPPRLLAEAGTVEVAVRSPMAAGQEPVYSNTLAVRVVPPPEVVTTCPLPGATVLEDYSQRISARGGFPPYTYAVLFGELPKGMVVAGDLIRGRAAVGGSFGFSLYVSDAQGNNSTKECSLAVPGPLRPSPASVSFEMTSGGSVPAPVDVIC